MTEFGEMCWGARQRAVTVTGRRECGRIRIYGPDSGARASRLGALQGEGQLWNAPGREARTHRPALYRTTMVALPDFLSRISLADILSFIINKSFSFLFVVAFSLFMYVCTYSSAVISFPTSRVIVSRGQVALLRVAV